MNRHQQLKWLSSLDSSRWSMTGNRVLITSEIFLILLLSADEPSLFHLYLSSSENTAPLIVEEFSEYSLLSCPTKIPISISWRLKVFNYPCWRINILTFTSHSNQNHCLSFTKSQWNSNCTTNRDFNVWPKAFFLFTIKKKWNLNPKQYFSLSIYVIIVFIQQCI